MDSLTEDLRVYEVNGDYYNVTDIVDRIEGGRTRLQASIEQYEQGMDLIKHCRGILQAAEKKIEKISEKDKT